MKHASLFFIILLSGSSLFFSPIVSAQTISPEAFSIDAKAIYTDDGNVIVRWIPSNYKTWLWGRDSGFVLQRITLEVNDTILNPEDMNASIITVEFPPKTQSEWEASMATDSVVGVAAGAYFSDSFMVVGPANSGIVTAYNINNEHDNRYGLALFAADVSTLAAEMQNLYYKDEAVIPSCKYSYLIRPLGNTGNAAVRSGQASIRTTIPYGAPPPVEFSVTAGDSVATLVWNQAATGEHYSSYDVLRSEDGGDTFVKVNEYPITPMDHPNGDPADQVIYYSQLENNTTQYQFKVRGHSPFGFDGPATSPSEVQGVPALLDASVTVGEAKDLPSGIEINWGFPTEKNDQIQGFNILRATEREGTYTAINPGLLNASERSYIDHDPAPTSYYKVEFVDMNGNKDTSLPQLVQPKDSVPPDPPEIVQGEAIGTDGMLKIHWSPVASDDIMGYRVFMADHPDGDFGQVTSKWIPDTVFYCQVNVYSLTEHKFFKIKAVDFRENTSDFSPVCTVDLPDIVPPSQPVLKKAEPKPEGVMVTFAPSKSKDVQTHHILRKKKDEVKWMEIAVLDSLEQQNSISFFDTTAEKMYIYDYMVQAVDDANQKSNSKVFPAKTTGNGVRETVQQLEVKFVKSEGAIQLKWEYSNAYGIATFVIYRGTDANAMFEVASVLPQKSLVGGAYSGPNPFSAAQPGNTPNSGPGNGQLPADSFDLQQTGAPNTNHDTFYEYKDKQFLNFKPYFYAIGVRFEDGTSSPISVIESTSAY